MDWMELRREATRLESDRQYLQGVDNSTWEARSFSQSLCTFSEIFFEVKQENSSKDIIYINLKEKACF